MQKETGQTKAPTAEPSHLSSRQEVSSRGNIKPKTRKHESWSSEEENEEQSVLRLKSMKKEDEILGKYKSILYRQTNPLSTMSWLVDSINEIVNKPKNNQKAQCKVRKYKTSDKNNAKLLK